MEDSPLEALSFLPSPHYQIYINPQEGVATSVGLLEQFPCCGNCNQSQENLIILIDNVLSQTARNQLSFATCIDLPVLSLILQNILAVLCLLLHENLLKPC